MIVNVRTRIVGWVFLALFLQGALCGGLFAYPLVFTDSTGNEITIETQPQRVVSLVPSITEILFALGAGDAIKGITYHTVRPWEASQKQVVGGFVNPSPDMIDALDPDIIFCSFMHPAIYDRVKKTDQTTLVNLETGSVEDSLETILLLGRMFGRETAAQVMVAGIRADMDMVRRKLEKAGVEKKRVIRLMGRDSIMTPGRDSFQSELIALAGGIPPDFGTGDVVPVSLDQWFMFNPQVIYGCSGDEQAAEKFFSLPGWKDVEAVKNNRIFYFPCDLTCRASTHTGDFIQWLSASIYSSAFGRPGTSVAPDRVISVRPLEPDVEYIKKATIKESRVHDFINRSLVIELDRPMQVISTLDGPRQGITAIGNHYIPPQSWLLNHDQGLLAMKKEILDVLGLDQATSSFLFTGADMNHLIVQKETFRDLTVTVFATAGVDSNAMRASRDTGGYYEPGTINLIIMSNYRLSSRAMTRAIISATEAKTAALLDLDIRSSYQGDRYRATGTGTDNVMVVEGSGPGLLDNAGGHTRLGELISRCVHRAVTEAIQNQNGITAGNNIFWRLEKRGITLYNMVADKEVCDCNRPVNEMVAAAEALLLDARYKGFMEMALGLSDEYEKGLIMDLTLFEALCRDVVRMISGKEILSMKQIVTRTDVPQVIGMAVNALYNGIYYKED